MPKKITITLTDEQVKVLEHELIDIDDWIADAIDGRINHSVNVIANEAQEALMNDPDVETMPTKRDALVAVYMARPDYKNRAQKEAEEKARREAERTKADQKAPAKAGKP